MLARRSYHYWDTGDFSLASRSTARRGSSARSGIAFALLAMLSACSAPVLSPGPGSPPGSYFGLVCSAEGIAIAGADVWEEPVPAYPTFGLFISSTDGFYDSGERRPGHKIVHVTADGYRSPQREIDVLIGRSVRADFVLSPGDASAAPDLSPGSSCSGSPSPRPLPTPTLIGP
jgi:hypothetical protein